MDGILYGIGTGPGDPELLTLKAVRKIRDCSVIAVPVSDREYASEEGHPDEETQKKYCRKCVAYQIAEKEIPEMEKMEKIYLPMPMVKEKEVLERAHERSASIEEQLKKGRDVAFLTLGDPSVYSTYLYVRKKIEARGFQTVIIPGVPSFCAAAARLGTGLSENVEELHILPASYQIEEDFPAGTKVLMKQENASGKGEYPKERRAGTDGYELWNARGEGLQGSGRDAGRLLPFPRDCKGGSLNDYICPGAGPGAEDLITVRGQKLLMEADIVIYAGSLVNPELLSLCKEGCQIYNSAYMTLEEVLDVMKDQHPQT